MATTDDAHEALLAKIAELAKGTNSAARVLELAEAYAWVTYPNNAHGGGGDK